jgi:hypothetical protein
VIGIFMKFELKGTEISSAVSMDIQSIAGGILVARLDRINAPAKIRVEQGSGDGALANVSDLGPLQRFGAASVGMACSHPQPSPS